MVERQPKLSILHISKTYVKNNFDLSCQYRHTIVYYHHFILDIMDGTDTR